MKCEKNHSNGNYSASIFSRLERRREMADIPIDAELKRLQNDRNVFWWSVSIMIYRVEILICVHDESCEWCLVFRFFCLQDKPWQRWMISGFVEHISLYRMVYDCIWLHTETSEKKQTKSIKTTIENFHSFFNSFDRCLARISSISRTVKARALKFWIL